MAGSNKRGWGGTRRGAGRPRSGFLDSMMATGRSRSSLYRDLTLLKNLSPEARAFLEGCEKDFDRLVTGKAMLIAGDFESPEAQIETLKLAVEYRKKRKSFTIMAARLHLQKLHIEG